MVMRKCEKCGAPTRINGRGHAFCDDCKRKAREKTCASCGKSFNGLRHICPTCRMQRGKCVECGAVCSLRARRCQPCHSRYRAGVGENHWNWKGGRHKEKRSGYVLIVVDGKQKAEHRHVMEQVLGRPLVKGENVHHRNGVRDDNRPENLELWVSSQPGGQRVVDLVAWAHEILERYEPIVRRSE